MVSNHWFDLEEDFNMLCIFMEALNEPYLYCTVPDFDNCPDLKILFEISSRRKECGVEGGEVLDFDYLLSLSVRNRQR